MTCLADEIDIISPSTPYISIIIDDMGYRLEDGKQAIALPGKLTFSFLPGTPYSETLARLANEQHKQVMLHLPLEPITKTNMEKGSITLSMNKTQTLSALDKNIRSIPHLSGINNHMGSLYTQNETKLGWLMARIKQHENLFFVDSYTDHTSVAVPIARQHQVPTIKRDVFLDNEHNNDDMAFQFARLVYKARKQGAALAIAHPHKTTIRFLKNKLPELARLGIKLVSVSELIQIKTDRSAAWHMSSSLSHKVAKSLKP